MSLFSRASVAELERAIGDLLDSWKLVRNSLGGIVESTWRRMHRAR